MYVYTHINAKYVYILCRYSETSLSRHSMGYKNTRLRDWITDCLVTYVLYYCDYTLYNGLCDYTLYDGLCDYTLYNGLCDYTLYDGLCDYTLYNGRIRENAGLQRCHITEVPLYVRMYIYVCTYTKIILTQDSMYYIQKT